MFGINSWGVNDEYPSIGKDKIRFTYVVRVKISKDGKVAAKTKDFFDIEVKLNVLMTN